MSFDVIIPWQDNCPYRVLALDWVVATHDSLDHNVIIGHLDPDRPWCKALAVQEALKQSTAEHILISDADVWCSSTELAVQALNGHEWAMPFRNVRRLSPEATSRTLRTGDLSGSLQQRPYLGVAGGGMMAIPRENYDHCPLDPRFIGWGQEDEAWGAALVSTFGKGWRGSADLHHLWHPPQARQSRTTGSDGSRALRNQYTKALRLPGGVASLVAEARSALVETM